MSECELSTRIPPLAKLILKQLWKEEGAIVPLEQKDQKVKFGQTTEELATKIEGILIKMDK